MFYHKLYFKYMYVKPGRVKKILLKFWKIWKKKKFKKRLNAFAKNILRDPSDCSWFLLIVYIIPDTNLTTTIKKH